MIPAPLIFDNANDLHEGMCEKLMFGSKAEGDIDWVHGTEVGLHNVMLGARSFTWDLNLKRLWLPPSRWTMMVRQYIDPDAHDDWLDKIEERMTGKFAGRKGRGIAVLRTRNVQGRGTGRSVRRRWGSCMLNVSFRANPVPTFTLHARTTYFGYLAAMDITVAHCLAREVSEITGIPVEDMQFVYTLDLAQFHGFRSLAWPLMDDPTREQMDVDLHERRTTQWNPGYRKALDGYHRIKRSDDEGKLYGDEAFSSFARVRRRFHVEVYGVEYAQQFEGGARRTSGFPPLPDTWAHDLDIATPLSGRDSDGVAFEEEDDDE